MTNSRVVSLRDSKLTRMEILTFLKHEGFATAQLLNYRDMKPQSFIIQDDQGLAAVALVSDLILAELPYSNNQRYLEYLVVRSDVQNQGLGSFLVRVVQKERPKRPLYLHCYKESLVSYYQRLGFKVKDQKDVSEFFMECRPWSQLQDRCESP